jgi:hypothetical protein
MSDTTYQGILHRHARQRQRALGKALLPLFAGLVAEPACADHLLLLTQCDERRRLAAIAK